MKLEDIRKIKQTTDEGIVNEYLAKGYRLMKIISAKVAIGQVEEIKPMYVLGLGDKDA